MRTRPLLRNARQLSSAS